MSLVDLFLGEAFFRKMLYGWLVGDALFHEPQIGRVYLACNMMARDILLVIEFRELRGRYRFDCETWYASDEEALEATQLSREVPWSATWDVRPESDSDWEDL